MSILGREAKVEAVIMNVFAPSDEKNLKIAGGRAKCKKSNFGGAVEH